MPIYKGTPKTGAAYKGSTSLSRIYKGAYLVFEAFKTLIAEGVPPITLLNCAAEILLGYKIYGNSKQQLLPDGYTQLEYIESTGTQYIDTGVVYDSTKKYTIYQDIECTGAQSVKGSGWNSGGAIFLNNQSEWYDGNLGNTGFSGDERVKVTIDIAKNSDTDTTYTWYSVDSGTTFTNTRGHSSLGTYAGSIGYPLFTSTVSGGAIGSQYNMFAKLYGASISVDDTLVRNLIPAKNSSNVVGLYDTVNNTFYANAGTGTFTAGQNAPTPDAPVEIQSVGDKTNNLFNAQQIATDSNIPIIDGKYLRCRDFYAEIAVINGTFKENTQYTLKIKAVCQNNEAAVVQFWAFYKDGTSSLLFSGEVGSSHQEIDLIGTTTAGKTVDYIDSHSNFYSTYYLVEIEGSQLVEGAYTSETMPAYEPYGYKIPVKTASPNLLPYPYIIDSGTLGGIEVTINDDGSIKLNGRSAGFNPTIGTFRLKAGTYTISGNPSPDVNLWLRVVGSASSAYYVRNNNGIKGTLTIAEDSDMYVYITINSGITVNDVIIYPMVNEGSTDLQYSKYFTPETTNIYLDEPLRKLGDYSDYLDFETGKVVRKINYNEITGLYNEIARYSNYSRYGGYQFNPRNVIGLGVEKCNYLPYTPTPNGFIVGGNTTASYYLNDDLIGVTEEDDTGDKRKAKAVAWLQSLSPRLRVYYVLATETEETVTLPDILMNKGTNIISVGTSVQPSNMWIKYKGK